MSNEEVIQKVSECFPGALSNTDLITRVQNILEPHGYGDTTLLATSLDCDEVNRSLERELVKSYGDNFSMGGLAGFPFGGVTSFCAMAHHIPTGGSCLLVYGPHVGVDSDCAIGKIDRRGRETRGVCCGSSAAAWNYVKQVRKGDVKAAGIPKHPMDAQQTWVGKLLLPHAARLEMSKNPEVELPLALFDAQDEFMKKIVDVGCREIAGNGMICLLGGVQINTPKDTSDYFLPKVFEIRTNNGDLVENLLPLLISEPFVIVS